MNKLAKEIDFLQKKIRFIRDSYSLLSFIFQDISDVNNSKILPLNIILEKYERDLRVKNLQHSRETRQIDIEQAIEVEKNNKNEQ